MEPIPESCYLDPSVESERERLTDMYNAPFARMMGIEPVSIKPDSVKMKMILKPEFKNSHGIGHGAAIYALADHTFAFASNIFNDATGQCCNIIYHRPAVGDVLESESRLINDSRSLSIHEVCVYCEGKMITSGTYTAFKLQR